MTDCMHAGKSGKPATRHCPSPNLKTRQSEPLTLRLAPKAGEPGDWEQIFPGPKAGGHGVFTYKNVWKRKAVAVK